MGNSKKSPPPAAPGPPGNFTIVIKKGDEILLTAEITTAGGLEHYLGKFILEFMETVKKNKGGNSHAIFPDGQPAPRPPRKTPNKSKKKKDHDSIAGKP